jgi:DNA-binding SARP family transcriptional activator
MSTPEAVRSKATIRLLGRFEVVIDGTPVDDSAWRGRKAQQLVKLLAVANGRSLHREQIADALWPDLDADAADRQLHKAIHAARRALEPDLGAGADSAWVLTQDRTVALSPTVAIDADEAESAAEAALVSRNVSACEAALEPFLGPLLPGDLYDVWSEARRARLASLHGRLLAAVAEGSLSAGRPERAADAANRLVAIDAADERAHRVLMQVASTSGDRSAVVRQFRTCEAALDSELGVEPSDVTRALFEDLVERSSGAEGAASAASFNPAASVTNAPDRVDRSAATTTSGREQHAGEIDAAPASGWISGRRRFISAIVAILCVACAAVVLAVPQLRSAIWVTQPAGPHVAAVAGSLPTAFVRVSLPSSDAGWSAFTNSEGRFVIRDAGVREGDTVSLVVESGGSERREIVVRIPAGDESGTADLGYVDAAAMTPIDGAVRHLAERVVPFDRVNLEWYRGVAAAVTAGLSTDHDRVNALNVFVARRYSRPLDNDPTDTPRRTIEAGTLFSGPLPIALATLTQASGYPTRFVALSAPRPVDIEHTVVEVFYDGRWHLFDPAFGMAAVNDLGEISNLEDLVRHPSLIDRMPYAEAVRPGWRGAEIPALFRSGVHRVSLLGSTGR